MGACMRLSNLWTPTWVLIVGVLIIILYYGWIFYKRKKVKKAILHLASGAQEMSAEDFIKLCEVREGKRSVSNQSDFTGIYIIHNVSKDMYYVGQSKNVLKRISSHLGGSGNGDVYADMKYGDEFTVKAISLVQSDYDNLDDLERDAIQAYRAFEDGYNKTRGNRARG